MINTFLDDATAADIDVQVTKILRDLGRPEPPLDLGQVREMLRLDLKYYSTVDTGALDETVHRFMIGGRQVVDRPRRLLELVQRLDLRALWIPDRRRILIDEGLATPRQRWAEGHEIIHGIIPWHQFMLHGDRETTLSQACHKKIELEANFGAGRLLFLQDRFAEEVASSVTGMESVRKLAKAFGNSLTSTLWRYVENHPSSAFGVVGRHPRAGEAGMGVARYFVKSRVFAKRFQGVTIGQIQKILEGCCRAGSGPLGTDMFDLVDVDGEEHSFGVDSFFNGYDALTLGWHLRKTAVLQAIP